MRTARSRSGILTHDKFREGKHRKLACLPSVVSAVPADLRSYQTTGATAELDTPRSPATSARYPLPFPLPSKS